MAKKIKKNKNLVKNVDGSSLKVREKGQLTSTNIENPSRDDIIRELRTGTCTIFFYKSTNGNFRRMVCTLSKEQPVVSKYNRQEVVVVWDLEANQWRSFYPDRVFRLVRDEETDAE